MRFILDTNAVIALLRGDTGFLERLRAHEPGDFGLSAIVAHEMLYGAYKSQPRTEDFARVDALRFEITELR